MRRIVSSDRFSKVNKKKENLFDDFNVDEPEEQDLYDQLNSVNYNDAKDLYDEDGEEFINDSDEDTFDADSLYDINAKNDYTTEEPEDNVDYVKVGKGADSLLSVLRDELKLKECDRGYLTFKYRGEIYDGIPMAEINPSKFVFSIDNKMKSILLSEITVM